MRGGDFARPGVLSVGTQAIRLRLNWRLLFSPPIPNFIGDTFAYAINNDGLIVGKAEIALGLRHAVYWRADGSVVDLNSLIDPASGWTLTVAGVH